MERLLERRAEYQEKYGNNGFGLTLWQTVAIMESKGSWATPKASDPAKAGPNMRGSKGDVPLPAQAVNWPTPIATEARQGYQARINSSGQQSLSTIAMDFPSSAPAPATPAGPTSSPERRTLNPLFVEWLMGLPIGWTGSAPVETASPHWWQDMRGELSRLVSQPMSAQATLL